MDNPETKTILETWYRTKTNEKMHNTG